MKTLPTIPLTICLIAGTPLAAEPAAPATPATPAPQAYTVTLPVADWVSIANALKRSDRMTARDADDLLAAIVVQVNAQAKQVQKK